MNNIKLLIIALFLTASALHAQDEKIIYRGEFEGVRCRGMATFQLIPSDSGYVSLISSDDEIQNYITVTEQGSVLNVDVVKKNVNITKILEKVIIKIYFVELNHVVMEGAGMLETVGPIITDQLIAAIRGTCVVEMEVECSDLEVKVTGTSELTIAGKAKHALINVEGIGSYNGKKLEAEVVDVKLEGIGNAVVNATYELKAKLSGVGTIEYVGDPDEKDFNIDGVGNIKRQD